MTQRELASQMGWTEQHLSDLLNRQSNTTIETLEMIANAFAVPPGFLISVMPEIPETPASVFNSAPGN